MNTPCPDCGGKRKVRSSNSKRRYLTCQNCGGKSIQDAEGNALPSRSLIKCPACGHQTHQYNHAPGKSYRACSYCQKQWVYSPATGEIEQHFPRKVRSADAKQRHNHKPHDAHVIAWAKIKRQHNGKPKTVKPPVVPRTPRVVKPTIVLATKPKAATRRSLDDIALDRQLFPVDPLFS